MTYDSNRLEKIHDEIKDKVQLKPGSLPEKVNASRDSSLTIIWRQVYAKVIYNVFLVIVFSVLLSETLHYFTYRERPSTLKLIKNGFGKFVPCSFIWLLQFATTVSVFYCFKFWANVRGFLPVKTINVKQIWDLIWIFLLLSYYFSTFYYLAVAVKKFNFPGGTAAFLLIDGIRVLMKIQAFVRTSAAEVLEQPEKINNKHISTFIYFLFAPTLLYRDEYPRSKTIQWSFVLKSFVEIMGSVVLCAFLCTHVLDSYKDFGKRKFSYLELFTKILELIPPTSLMLLLWFYCMLHSWQNFFAEILTFGDRLFYKDWWTSTTYSRYYKTWNVVVHDWLYTYIYKDVWNLTGKNRFVSKLSVFFVSAVVHEYVLIFVLDEFCPILFITFFFIGTGLSYLQVPDTPVWNALFWIGFSLGFSIQISLYTLEWFARNNRDVVIGSLWDFLVPQLLVCGECYQ